MNVVLGQSIRFGAVGLVNTAIGLAAIYAVMFFFRTGPAIANAIGYAIGFTVSFALNRSWTCRSDVRSHGLRQRHAASERRVIT